MGYYKYVRELWKKPQENLGDLWKERLIAWRKEPVTVRLKYPTRIDRARSLGYKAKPGFIIVRQRVKRGGRQNPKTSGGRKSKRASRRKDLRMNYQTIAEMRAAKKFANCEVLNSYWIIQDGLYYWYEVILVDKSHLAIIGDKDIGWISEKQHTRRAFRGLTSSARKSRGLLHKGKGAEKVRPSLRANLRKAR